MTSAATAKILLFIALSLGPRSTPDTIVATSNSDNYAWFNQSGGWSLETKGLPADEWSEQGNQEPLAARQERDFQVIARHHWAYDGVLNLKDGSQVMKQNGTVFYIQNPGAPNQKVFTILYRD